VNPGVLVAVALAAMDDPELKVRLVEGPTEVAASLHLDEQELEGMARLGAEGIDTIIGSLVVYRLLPFPVGEKLMIAPSGLARRIDTERGIILLDQTREGGWIGSSGTSAVEGKTFGSGNHPTTALALAELEVRLQPGDHVLDLGTGSGVVAIAAALLGARSVDAVDIDPFAVETARRNVVINRLQDRIHVTGDDLEALLAGVGAGGYDLIVSNILGSVHLANLQAGLADLLAPGGRLILSGFEDGYVPELSRALESQGLRPEAVARSGSWAGISVRRPLSGPV
jgi:ribosomal protein L11 methylase PrmA